jgi:hypothetical protein
VAAFSASLSAAAPGYGGNWAATLDAISAAVDTLTGLQGAASNPLSSRWLSLRLCRSVALHPLFFCADSDSLTQQI